MTLTHTLRRLLHVVLLLILAALALVACGTQTDDSSVAGFAEELPLAADRPTFVYFFADD